MKRKMTRDEIKRLPEYLQDATNVYRTRHYIVKQIISVRYDERSYNMLVSTDTFYRRTRALDEEYEYFLDFMQNIDGKRIPTAMSNRRYVQ